MTRQMQQAKHRPSESIARMPDFNEDKLAFLLLPPHPKTPTRWPRRSEVTDLADYIATLK